MQPKHYTNRVAKSWNDLPAEVKCAPSFKNMSNALAVLPRLNQCEMQKLQTAANSAIRAILGLPRYGHYPISDLRKKLRIPSVIDLRDRLLNIAAWKKFCSKSDSSSMNGPITRAKSEGKVIHPIQKGFRGQMIDTKLDLAWNSLPKSIKEENRQAHALKPRDSKL